MVIWFHTSAALLLGYSEDRTLHLIEPEIKIMNAVLDSMAADGEAIEDTGLTSTMGRLVSRAHSEMAPVHVRQVIDDMFDQRMLIIRDGVVELDITKARERVKYLCSMVDGYNSHPAIAQIKDTLRDAIHAVMDKVTAALSTRSLATNTSLRITT